MPRRVYIPRLSRRYNPYLYLKALKRLNFRLATYRRLERIRTWQFNLKLKIYRKRSQFRMWRINFKRRYILRWEVQSCPRRFELPGPWKMLPELDFWYKVPNGDMVCSFCGSAHPDVFFRVLKEATDPNNEARISMSDKRYKVYLKIPGIKNAGEGPIKFYTQHLRQPVSLMTEAEKEALDVLWFSAQRESNTKFNARFMKRQSDQRDAS